MKVPASPRQPRSFEGHGRLYLTLAQTRKIEGEHARMYHLDPRPYPRLTAEQKDNVLREVALYLSLQAPVPTEGEQLELFPPGTSERLDVSNVLDV
jgi:hypothetical protein